MCKVCWTEISLSLVCLVHKQRLLQTSHLHTLFECRGPAARTLLGRRQQQGKFLWVSAAAVRHNSSQVSWQSGDWSVGEVAEPLHK